MRQAIQRQMSREDYLAFEEKSEEKHEFFQGEIFAMAGGSMRQAIQQQISRENYLAFEKQSEEKHEFFQGEIFAMAGGSFNHAAIAGNTYAALTRQLTQRPCRPMNSDMRIHTPAGLDTYPDVSVFCGEPELDDKQHTLLNPVLIIEVLSPSTRTYDRGDKFALYRSIPSLQDYLLIDSEQIHVEHYRRLPGAEWLLHEYNDLSDEISLESIESHLSLTMLYSDIGF